MTNRLGIYVHIPFCVHKCSYCDFYSFAKFEPSDLEKFKNAVVRQARSAAQWLGRNRPLQWPVTSIFFGGGTPSLLPGPALAEILQVLKDEYPLSDKVEITLEANPETVTPSLAQFWNDETPVNRVSLGAQSFEKPFLEKLERLGSPENTQEAVRILKRAGFSNLNLDLIVGIPGQTVSQAERDIALASQQGITHMSNYNLTLKPGHPLFKELPGEDESVSLYECAVESMAKHGLAQYEISNYAKEGFECQHNLLYWAGGDFLGLGPSAASRFFWGGVFCHRKEPADYSSFLTGGNFSQTPFSQSSLKQTQLEAAFLELRRNIGISLTGFQQRYGLDFTKAQKYGIFEKEGLIVREGDRLRLSERGKLLADTVTADLV